MSRKSKKRVKEDLIDLDLDFEEIDEHLVRKVFKRHKKRKR